MPAPIFTPRSYFNAAQEHLGIARQLLDQSKPHYFVAHYFAGIAVEDILRALSVRAGEPFDGTHDIEHWAKKANLLPDGSSEKSKYNQDEFRVLLDEINKRWRANQRYFTEKMLDTHLEFTRLDRIRGERIKFSSKRLFECATTVVEWGVNRWKSNNK